MLTSPAHAQTGDGSGPGVRRTRRASRGQSLVEFALVFPIFILLLAGMIDFGLALNTNITITNAAREGARLGAVAKDSAAITSRVQSMATGLTMSALTVRVRCYHGGALEATYVNGTLQGSGTCTWATGDDVEVRVSYDYAMIWPLTFGTQIAMASTVDMRIE